MQRVAAVVRHLGGNQAIRPSDSATDISTDDTKVYRTGQTRTSVPLPPQLSQPAPVPATLPTQLLQTPHAVQTSLQ